MYETLDEAAKYAITDCWCSGRVMNIWAYKDKIYVTPDYISTVPANVIPLLKISNWDEIK